MRTPADRWPVPQATRNGELPSYETILLEEWEPGIYVLTLNRPEKLNAMTSVTLAEIPDACRTVSSRANARALIVRGAGRGFSAGADRSMVAERKGRDKPYALPELIGKEAALMEPCEVPAIAAIHGAAAGAGMGVALNCDFRVMAKGSYFLEAHVAIGLTPTMMAWWLPRLVGLSVANDVILRGRKLGAEEALDLRLATAVVEEDQLMPTALDLARELAQLPPFTVRMAKEAMRVAQSYDRLLAVREFGSIANRAGQVAGSDGSQHG